MLTGVRIKNSKAKEKPYGIYDGRWLFFLNDYGLYKSMRNLIIQ